MYHWDMMGCTDSWKCLTGPRRAGHLEIHESETTNPPTFGPTQLQLVRFLVEATCETPILMQQSQPRHR